ncbi:hypothetical protein AMTRI_Chr02g219630 [Amborella trichopoda]
MTTKSPIFPMPEPQHYSDYGFDPQIDYFQVLEEAKKYKKEGRTFEAHELQVLKPLQRDEEKKSKKRWWKRSVFLFWKWKRSETVSFREENIGYNGGSTKNAVSGPVYGTEGWRTPCRSSRPSSGPLSGMVPELPYLNLKDLNYVQPRISTSTPIYLVT